MGVRVRASVTVAVRVEARVERGAVCLEYQNKHRRPIKTRMKGETCAEEKYAPHLKLRSPTMAIAIATTPLGRVQGRAESVGVRTRVAATAHPRVVDDPHTLTREILHFHTVFVLVPRVFIGWNIPLLDIHAIGAGSPASAHLERRPQLRRQPEVRERDSIALGHLASVRGKRGS